jgi:Flp pilus assembly protein TadD
MDGAFAQIEEALSLDPKNSIAYSSLAVLEMSKGNNAKAEAAFTKAVELNPTSSVATLALGNFYWSTGDFARAETHLKQAASLAPTDPLPRRALALLYLITRRPEQAEPHLQALAQDASDARGILTLADYYTLLGNPDRAKDTIVRFEAARGESPATRLRVARLAYDAGDRKQAIDIVVQLLATQPNQFDALLTHGRWLLAEGQSALALMRGRAAAAVRPNSAAAHYLVGASLVAQGRSDLALNEFTQVLKYNPYATAARVEMARIYMEDGVADAALRIAEEARRVDPNSPAAKLAHARVLLLQRDFKRAEPIVRSLVATYPKSAQAQALLGGWHLVKGDAKPARAAFERAAAIDADLPEAVAGLVRLDVGEGRAKEAKTRVDARLAKSGDSPDMLMVAAATYLAAGAIADAEATLRRVIEIAPTNMDAYAMLGRLYIAQNRADAAANRLTGGTDPTVGEATMAALMAQVRGNQAEARQRYQAILKQHPRAPVAANNLAWLYATSGENLEEAERLARTAYEEMPRNAQVANTVGFVYLKKNVPTLALSPLEQSVARSPANPTYHYHVGLAYAGTQQFPRARAAFERALELDPNGPHVQEIRTALAALPAAGPR